MMIIIHEYHRQNNGTTSERLSQHLAVQHYETDGK